MQAAITPGALPEICDLPEACQYMPAEQRLFCVAILVLASIPFVYVGAAVRWWVG